MSPLPLPFTELQSHIYMSPPPPTFQNVGKKSKVTTEMIPHAGHRPFYPGMKPFTMVQALSPGCKPFTLLPRCKSFHQGTSPFVWVQALLSGCKPFCLGASPFAQVQALLPGCEGVVFCLLLLNMNMSHFSYWYKTE